MRCSSLSGLSERTRGELMKVRHVRTLEEPPQPIPRFQELVDLLMEVGRTYSARDKLMVVY